MVQLLRMDPREALRHTDRTSMDVYLVSSRVLSCNYDLKEKSFYRAFNAIFGKVGRVA